MQASVLGREDWFAELIHDWLAILVRRRNRQPSLNHCGLQRTRDGRKMLDLAAHIITSKSGHFDPAQFEDRYENALVDLLKKKEAGEKIEPAKAGPAPRVVNLMEALRASLDTAKKKAPAPSVQDRRPAKRRRAKSDSSS